MSDTFSNQTMRLVGYFPAEARKQDYGVDEIPAELLTSVIYAFAGLQADGACVSVDKTDDDTNFPLLFQLKQDHPDLQILISVGGANATGFPVVAASEVKRLNFVQTAVQFMTQNNFDGVDIDWEFPAAADSANFTTMLKELRSQLDAQGAAVFDQHSRGERALHDLEIRPMPHRLQIGTRGAGAPAAGIDRDLGPRKPFLEPPADVIATSAPCTCRGPAAPRSWRTASPIS